LCICRLAGLAKAALEKICWMDCCWAILRSFRFANTVTVGRKHVVLLELCVSIDEADSDRTACSCGVIACVCAGSCCLIFAA
jgi:hypothetical protein